MWAPLSRGLPFLGRQLNCHRCPVPRPFSNHRGRVLISTQSAGTQSADVLVIGGGPVGLSTAYHLARMRGGDGRGIVILERDPTYKRASATLSAGGIRQQFSLRENVEMSMYGRDFLRDAAELLRTANLGEEEVDVQFREHGYLFLACSDSGRKVMRENHEVQREAGCEDARLLDPSELSERFPWINIEDVLLGSYGEKGEGWFDPWALISALKNKTVDMGVKYVHGAPIGARRDERTGMVLSVDVEERSVRTRNISRYSVGQIVNAAGAHASSVMDLLAGTGAPLVHPLPVRPRKRCIFFFHCSAPHGVPPVAPLTVDSSLVYFRSEGSSESANFLCGVSPMEDEDRDCHDDAGLDYVDHHLFEDRIWPALFHRVPAFGEIKVRSSWAGLYDYNTIDQNAIIGFHPEVPNIVMANGFSGHGLQHSPAAGRAAAELLEQRMFRTLDLHIFSFERVLKGEAVFEHGIV